MKDSLTHRRSSQDWAPGVLPFFCTSVLFVSCMYLDGGMGVGRWLLTSLFLFYYLYSWASIILFMHIWNSIIVYNAYLPTHQKYAG